MSKLRSRLTSERVDKLLFIYTNERVIRRSKIGDFEEDYLIALEDGLITTLEDSTEPQLVVEEEFIPSDWMAEGSFGVVDPSGSGILL
jgi:hypothetical protein